MAKGKGKRAKSESDDEGSEVLFCHARMRLHCVLCRVSWAMLIYLSC